MTPSPHASADVAAEPEHTNRLVHETSPYLLQHAHNPVDWYAWGPEAFEAARAANKPIFLSIGYSTCYWCHVMERESFEDEEVARILNENFIAIKLDREERPDVDDIYMTAVQLMTGSGGWPMSLFLEPEGLQPFFGGTYFPKRNFMALLEQVSQVWQTRRDDIATDAGRLAAAVSQSLRAAAESVPLGEGQVNAARQTLMEIYDRQDGGFGGGGPRANKFPMPVYLELLLAVAWDDQAVRGAVIHTLDRMATGGMYDQIGGGFHRYSTDTKWLVPHFEKMLYDNGQLASVYAEAYARTGDAYYGEIVRETLEYVLREMSDPAGGFFSAQDAEVNAREGGNYVWVADEIREALTDAGLAGDVDFALEVYGFSAGTNFRDPHHPEDGWKNVVYLRGRPDALAEQMGMTIEAFNERLERVNEALLAVRDRRDQPGTDDKILTGWNGLMVAGMADGGRVLQEPRYVDAARRAAEWILSTMLSDDGGLLRTYRAGEAKINAFSVDYAFLIRGLLALQRATGESGYTDEAVKLAAAADERFWDEGAGGYFDTLSDQSDLFVRVKSTYDGAVPSANSVMALNLLGLYELTGDEAYLDRTIALLRGISSHVDRSPVATALATAALDRINDRFPLRLAGQPKAAPATKDPVSVETSTQQINVSSGAPVSFEVTLRMAKGYHINAHEPGQPNLIGLNLQLVGAEGLSLHPEYPRGELFRGEIRIHGGELTVPVRVEQTGPVDGTPSIALTYQVCTDRLCLAPTTTVLPIEIVTE